MRDAKIVTLYKNKGDRSNYNNFRGISLDHTWQTLRPWHAHAPPEPGQPHLLRVSMGFGAEHSIKDMNISLRQLQEKCREQ